MNNISHTDDQKNKNEVEKSILDMDTYGLAVLKSILTMSMASCAFLISLITAVITTDITSESSINIINSVKQPLTCFLLSAGTAILCLLLSYILSMLNYAVGQYQNQKAQTYRDYCSIAVLLSGLISICFLLLGLIEIYNEINSITKHLETIVLQSKPL